MQLMKLSLFQFRNYQEAEIHFSQGVHILYGKNGAGKTSILESIFYLALTRSFRSSKDYYLIQNSRDMFRLQGEFSTETGNKWRCSIAYSTTEGKRLLVDGQRVHRFADYIGEVPIVMLAPSDLQIVQAGPGLRRRFLDILLSQSSKIYLHHLMQYKRSLKQRNQLLQTGKNVTAQDLEPWEETLVLNGAEIIRRRQEALSVLSELAGEYYRELSQTGDRVELVYRSDVLPGDADETAAVYRRQFDKKRQKEILQRTTLIGPHRDDVAFLLNGKSMRSFASQGEQKTMVVALKLAEFHYLQQQSQKAPILLFDDIFGELDAERIQHLLRQLGNIGQVFVTTTSRNFFDKIPKQEYPTHYYHVRDGKIEFQENICGAGQVN